MEEREQCAEKRVAGPYNSTSRAMALRVVDFIRGQNPAWTEAEVEGTASVATGVSISSIQRFKKEFREGRLHSPPSKRKRTSPVMDSLDNFDEACLRRTIVSFYERGDVPTLDAILERVKEAPINFKGAKSSLNKILKKMGFTYDKVRSGRKILMERQDIVSARCAYLRQLRENREEDDPRYEVFLDETWVNQNECVAKCWTDEEGTLGPKVKTGRGARFIILHAGGVNGFVPGSLLMFRSKNGNKGDYHDSMNHEKFTTWFKNQLLENIPPRSLIVMDNASYHNKIENKAPTKCSTKGAIITWLDSNNIEHNPTLPKAELLDFVKRNSHHQVYAIDKIAMEHGHKVIRLPPYHCQLNPIELVWAQIKSDVRKHNSNSDQTLKRVEQLTKAAIEKVTKDKWQKCVEHTMKIEEEFRKRDVVVNHFLEKVIVNLEDTSSEED